MLVGERVTVQSPLRCNILRGGRQLCGGLVGMGCLGLGKRPFVVNECKVV